jgi:hypothetical protein
MPLTFVATEVTLSPRILAPGQTIELTVTATNWGEETVYPSNGCAPGLGFSVTRPDSVDINPYPAAWPCGEEDTHLLEPGETDSVVFRWSVPELLGEYEVVGGVVVGDRIWSLSEPETFEVRAEG